MASMPTLVQDRMDLGRDKWLTERPTARAKEANSRL